MNIKLAKEKIKDAVTLYLKKNAKGEYILPVNKQRPVFIIGSPGIGKTAIMQQIADELDIALVSYSMTHHTRQSALGLPKIETMEYDGQEYDISRYTMSEIIASVYDVMKSTGKKEGILFLDEINCVSETLAPALLLFLQYKIFGSYEVPKGWVIVTAGNPPIYNRQVREFDVVTMDRLRVLEVEADYESFREYGVNKNLHPAIIAYLDTKKENFYIVKNSKDDKQYVTSRGWEDLSDIIKLSELEGILVDKELVLQYLRHDEVARDFADYYELFCKYKKDYRINDILDGADYKDTKEIYESTTFDERLAIIELCLDRIRYESGKIKAETNDCNEMKAALAEADKEAFKERVVALKSSTAKLQDMYQNTLEFVNDVFHDDEMTLLVGELSAGDDTAWFIATFGVEAYTKYSEKLLFTDKGEELRAKCNRILK